MNATQRAARPGELCTCGRPAVQVFITDHFGEVGYCGLPDGGASFGPCPFCGGDRHEGGRCPEYRLVPGAAWERHDDSEMGR